MELINHGIAMELVQSQLINHGIAENNYQINYATLVINQNQIQAIIKSSGGHWQHGIQLQLQFQINQFHQRELKDQKKLCAEN